jgi:hypothetical protein
MSALKERASSAILGRYQLNTKVNAMRQWLRVTWLVLAFMGALSHTYLHAQTEPKNAGIVLLHGKWGGASWQHQKFGRCPESPWL